MTTFAADDYATIRTRLAELATERELLMRSAEAVCTCVERYTAAEDGQPQRLLGGSPPAAGCAEHGHTVWVADA